MPPPLLVDLSRINLAHVEYGIEAIRAINPQRHEMEQLDGVIAMNVEEKWIVGFKQIRRDEFWVRGHVPGRPLLPGVLMLEAAAQLCMFFTKQALGGDPMRFIGFGGVVGAKFRGTVVPGDRLLLLGLAEEVGPRRAVFRTQGVVGERMVFEATIVGMYV